ncbi:MAG: hypothetical protein CFE44_12860 [Burkholderiales bacterium PBB4]|nr:MAG: hypothetical protein CFE44_12860 [Burkholderiales bacterium PBB4]
MLQGFDTLCNQAQAQAVRQRHNRPHDGQVILVSTQMPHKGLVDLQHIKRETLQVRQAGVAGSEVVNREFQPQGFEAAQHGQGVLHVQHRGAFGHLQLELLGL